MTPGALASRGGGFIGEGIPYLLGMSRLDSSRTFLVGLFIAALCAAASSSAAIPLASSQSVTCPSSACVSVSIPSGASSSPSGYTQGQTTTYGFSPDTVTVVIGVNNTVQWTNDDSSAHTVTSNSGSPASFDSGESGPLTTPGGTFQFTFTVPGTYHYHCSFHSWMQGTVVVLASSTSTSTGSPASSGGVPEFPFQGALVVVVTLAILASYLVARKTLGVRGTVPGKIP